jgi:hypothetical protein
MTIHLCAVSALREHSARCTGDAWLACKRLQSRCLYFQPIDHAFEEVREFRERRFDGLASPEMMGTSRQPEVNRA